MNYPSFYKSDKGRDSIHLALFSKKDAMIITTKVPKSSIVQIEYINERNISMWVSFAEKCEEITKSEFLTVLKAKSAYLASVIESTDTLTPAQREFWDMIPQVRESTMWGYCLKIVREENKPEGFPDVLDALKSQNEDNPALMEKTLGTEPYKAFLKCLEVGNETSDGAMM